jgi:hypothetical protein
VLNAGVEVPAVRFAELARRLTGTARAAGLVVPAFRSPPRRVGAVRSIRRLPGGAVVAVRLRGRSLADVATDMVDGVLVTNGLAGESAARMRAELLAALRAPEVPAAPVGAPARAGSAAA